MLALRKEAVGGLGIATGRPVFREIPVNCATGITGIYVWSLQNGQCFPAWTAGGIFFEDPTSRTTRLGPSALQISTHIALPDAASARETFGATVANTIAKRAIHAASARRGVRNRRIAIS